MKTKTLKLSATDMPDNGQARVIHKQFELFGPGSRALAPNSIDRQAKADSIAKTWQRSRSVAARQNPNQRLKA